MKEQFDHDKYRKEWRKDFFRYFILCLILALIILVLFNVFIALTYYTRLIISVIYVILAFLFAVHIARDIAGPKADEVEYFLRKYTL